jgi:hypothetical protein
MRHCSLLCDTASLSTLFAREWKWRGLVYRRWTAIRQLADVSHQWQSAYQYGTFEHFRMLRTKSKGDSKVNICTDGQWDGDPISKYFNRSSCNHCKRETRMWQFFSKIEGQHTATLSCRVNTHWGLVAGGVLVVWPLNSPDLKFLCGVG